MRKRGQSTKRRGFIVFLTLLASLLFSQPLSYSCANGESGHHCSSKLEQIRETRLLALAGSSAELRQGHVLVLARFDAFDGPNQERDAVQVQHYGQNLKASLRQVSWPLRC